MKLHQVTKKIRDGPRLAFLLMYSFSRDIMLAIIVLYTYRTDSASIIAVFNKAMKVVTPFPLYGKKMVDWRVCRYSRHSTSDVKCHFTSVCE